MILFSSIVGLFGITTRKKIIPNRFQLINSGQEHHPFVRLVSFQTTVKLVSLKWTNSPFFQWLKHVHFPFWDVLLRYNRGELSCYYRDSRRPLHQHKLLEPSLLARERAIQNLRTSIRVLREAVPARLKAIWIDMPPNLPPMETFSSWHRLWRKPYFFMG
ncbi:MAG: hypothetical protein A4E63_00436 [Syntrophorhabdus sp. PtaU1.Bin050]|nr:MAG: hypothetical protein A4E63_00436 [Syntrophorhabdus sp. PtaU1.Bin050]